MWGLFAAQQTGSGLDWTALSTVLAALIALLGALVTVFFTVRSSNRADDGKREEAFDDRQDAELARVTAERDRRQDEVDRIREQYDRLWSARQATLEREAIYRRWIRAQGVDPDEVLTSD